MTYQLTPNISLDARYRWQGSELLNGGVQGFNLPGAGYTQHGTNQTVQLTETQIVNARTINESHFQFFSKRVTRTRRGNNPILEHYQSPRRLPAEAPFHSTTRIRRITNCRTITSITHGTQFIKFGARLRGQELGSYNTSNFLGQFNFADISAYGLMTQGLAQGVPLSQIIASGGGPIQYIFAGGQPLIDVSQVDAGLFFQDDWRVKPNLTVSLGLRYEIQNNIPDHGDFAPRIGVAWGLGPSQGRLRNPKTVLRAGFGYFYDRFSLNNVLEHGARFNGINDVAYTIPNPNFYLGAGGQLVDVNGNVVNNASLANPANAGSAQTDHLIGTYRSPRMQQAAVGLDRQLPKSVTVSVNYINSIGEHVLRTVDTNTPLPGTWNPLNPAASAYPLGYGSGIYDLYESSGMYKQNQLIFNTNARINPRISLFGFYAYGHVNTNVSGIGGSPSNPYNFNQDWGRANYDIRHRVSINGSIVMPFGIRLSPNITYNSAPPLNLVEGIDPTGDGLTTTARPALAPAGFAAPACTQQLARSLATCLVAGTIYGNFVINPPAGMPVIPINAFHAFGQFNFNMRISRTWGFGESTTPQNNPRRGQGGPGGPGFGQTAGGRGGGGARGGGGPGPGGMFGDSSGKRYTLTAGIMFHNLFNTVNRGQIENDLLSPRLGEPLAQANVGGFGGNANSQAFNRRIDLSLRFSF